MQPWESAVACPGLPRNAVTGRSHSGVNVLILWGEVIAKAYGNQGWLTVRQALVAGGCVRKGERGGRAADPGRLAMHDEKANELVIGRLVERGLHDELTGSAYAVVDGTDGRTRYLRFEDIEATSDAKPGAIVELCQWRDNCGNDHLSLNVKSDLSLGEQLIAKGSTWLDRQLVARDPVETAGCFGTEVRNALENRSNHLVDQGLAQRESQRFVFARDLLDTLRERKLADTAKRIASRNGFEQLSGQPDEHIVGIYRERITLASGRFAMIDDGLGFQLVPWQPSLDRHLGQAASGTFNARGEIDWSFTQTRTLGL